MNKKQLTRIKISGYKSIKECDLEIRKTNILIGANGAGKSNFIGFLKMVNTMLYKPDNVRTIFKDAVKKNGGSDALLRYGRKITEKLSGELIFGDNNYEFILKPTDDNTMMFSKECATWFKNGGYAADHSNHFVSNPYCDCGSSHEESKLEELSEKSGIAKYALEAIRSWQPYHFHDTGGSAKVKQPSLASDYNFLRFDAENLASFLINLQEKHKKSYDSIVNAVSMVAPFFGNFTFSYLGERVVLNWFERGKDFPMRIHALSDGTLRFICLATVFLQPEEFQPETIIIDEPELGLHPYALHILSELIKSSKKQVIIATQSNNLISQFDPEDLIIADRKNDETIFRRLPDKDEGLRKEDLDRWLEEYTLGELWEKDIFGGMPQ
jgi:predicted ATPase